MYGLCGLPLPCFYFSLFSGTDIVYYSLVFIPILLNFDKFSGQHRPASSFRFGVSVRSSVLVASGTWF